MGDPPDPHPGSPTHVPGPRRWPMTRHHAPPRTEWNRDPMFSMGSGKWCPKCQGCGYREWPINLISDEFRAPPHDHWGLLCFSCHLFVTSRDSTDKYWLELEANRTGKPVKQKGKYEDVTFD